MWKDIEGFPNYEISNTGLVFSNVRKGTRGISRLLKLQKDIHGYYYVRLYRNGKQYHNFIHCLVLENFVCKRPDNKVTNHKDGKKINNDLDNLEWITSSENTFHAYKLGLIHITDKMRDRSRKLGLSQKGENQGASKLTEFQIIEIRELYFLGKYNQYELAEKYNICQPTVSEIITRKIWKHI